MKTTQGQVQAEKADRYFESLSKHFARKVKVDKSETCARVHFPAGICLIELERNNIIFNGEAKTDNDLEIIKQIIDSHVNRFGELKDQSIDWS